MKLKYIWYRLRQAGVSAFMYLAPIRKAQVISGAGCLLQIPEKIKQDGKKKVMVVTTPGFIKRGSLVPFFEELKNQIRLYDNLKARAEYMLERTLKDR